MGLLNGVLNRLSGYCVACDEPSGDWFCFVCAQSLYENTVCCPRCALPQDSLVPLLCVRCRKGGSSLRNAKTKYRYGGELATAIAKLKNANAVWVARALGMLIRGEVAAMAADNDLVVCVPPAPKQFRKRGFDQCGLILRYAHCSLPLFRHLKRKKGKSQKGLSQSQRVANIRGQFFVPAKNVKGLDGKRILVLDDVITTGATVREVGRTLLRAGARSVDVFAVARAE